MLRLIIDSTLFFATNLTTKCSPGVRCRNGLTSCQATVDQIFSYRKLELLRVAGSAKPERKLVCRVSPCEPPCGWSRTGVYFLTRSTLMATGRKRMQSFHYNPCIFFSNWRLFNSKRHIWTRLRQTAADKGFFSRLPKKIWICHMKNYFSFPMRLDLPSLTEENYRVHFQTFERATHQFVYCGFFESINAVYLEFPNVER